MTTQPATPRKNKHIGRKVGIGIAVLLVILISAFFIYTGNYSHSTVSISQLEERHTDLKYTRLENSYVIEPEEESTKGLIFYPGGKVEYTAYGSLLSLLAGDGYTCLIVKMPFNLAVFDSNAADSIIDENTQIDEWYIAGHSLGGVMAESYAHDNIDKLNGLILLAAYGTKDISESDIEVLSIYGSNDKVLDIDKLNEAKDNLTPGSQTTIIQGGNHAQFGTYGEQNGDGKAEISSADQMRKTADAILGIDPKGRE